MNRRSGTVGTCRCARRPWIGIGLLLVTVAPPTRSAAQTPGTIVGAVAGGVQNHQVWSPSSETEQVRGLLLGAFVRVQTPVRWLSVLAEGTYTQRGGNVLDEVDGQILRGSIRSDYLTFSVHPRASVRVGPAHLHIGAGPAIEQVVRTRFDPGLRMVLERETPMVFGVGAGVGVGTVFAGNIHAELEARVFEGLGDAYSGDFVSVRNRSFEVVGRVGVPLRRR